MLGIEHCTNGEEGSQMVEEEEDILAKFKQVQICSNM